MQRYNYSDRKNKKVMDQRAIKTMLKQQISKWEQSMLEFAFYSSVFYCCSLMFMCSESLTKSPNSKAELPQVGILFGTQFSSLGIFISKKVGFRKN